MKHLFLYIIFAVLPLQVVLMHVKAKSLIAREHLKSLHAGAPDETVSSVPALIGVGMACRFVALSGQHFYGFASAGYIVERPKTTPLS
jgi:hypothetical protein